MSHIGKDCPHAVIVGDVVWIDGHEWVVLRAVTGEPAQFQNPRSGELRFLSAAEYLSLYYDNRAWRLPKQSNLDETLKERVNRLSTKHYESQTDKEKQELDRRLFYLRRLHLAGCRFTKPHIEEMLPGIAKFYQQEMGRKVLGWVEKAPTWRTVQDWAARKAAGGGSGMALATDNAKKGNRTRRLTDLVCRLVDEGIRLRMLRGGSSTDVLAYLNVKLKEAMPGCPDSELPTVSRQTIVRLYNKIPAWWRDMKKFGPRRVREIYRGGEGAPVPEYALDVVELDHTELPFLVYCHRRRMLLGRPVLALAIDVRTGAILGFYLGMLPEGDMTMMMAIRHAVLPKTYVSKLFPDIRNVWKQYGRWRVVILDRALQNFSESTRTLCSLLDTEILWAKPYTGWMKPHVEALNRVIQRSVGQNVKWNAIRALWEGDMAEVEKYPVVTYAALLHAIHKWIIDEYNQRPTGLLFQVPDDLWAESIEFCEPTLPDRRSDIDSVFGLTKTGTLTHRGIRYKHIIYYSDDLRRIREEMGDTVQVSFTLNPTNLGEIVVKHPRREEYYKARAIRAHRELVEGLTEYQYDRIRAYSWNQFKQRGNFRGYLRAREEMHQLLDKYFAAMNISDRTRVGRFEAVGTESVFADMSWEGEIGRFRGILAGEEETIGAVATGKVAATDVDRPPAQEAISPTAPQNVLLPRKRRSSKRVPASKVYETPVTPEAPPRAETPSLGGEEEFAPRPRKAQAPILFASIAKFGRK